VADPVLVSKPEDSLPLKTKADARQTPANLGWEIIRLLVKGGIADLRLTPPQACVLMSIARWCNNGHKSAFPSEETIGHGAGLGRKSAQRIKKALKAKAGLEWKLIRRPGARATVCHYNLLPVYKRLISQPHKAAVKAECEVFHDRNLSRSQPHSAARSANEIQKKKITSPTAPGDKSPVNDFVELWNSITAGILPKVKEISRGREAKIRARLKEHPDLAWWKVVFSALIRDDFHCGREPGKNWKADIDWIIRNDTNALKFAEGGPRSREKPARSCALCNGSGKWQDASGEPESGICPKCEGRGYD